MFFYLSQFRDQFFGLNIFRYITFRAGMAAVTTFLFCIVFGPLFIKKLQQMKIKEISKREDCPDLDRFSEGKDGTPTMGGLLIVSSIVVSVLLWADLTNRYIILTLGVCMSLAILGWVDDVFKLKGIGKRGLTKKTKLLWQILIGCFIGTYVFFAPEISTKLDVPFCKNLIINLSWLYIPFVAFIIIGATNAVNVTDGLDGLAIGCVLIVSLTLAILSYITGHKVISEYLFIPYISMASELTIFCSAMAGASLGFLWFNAYPASVFMGDVGSLPLGGTLGVIAVLIKKELLLVIIAGVFVVEMLSVVIQIASVKFRAGKRVFKVAPIHHHFQLSNWPESKIIIRFWIIAIICALIALTTLKIR